MASRRQRDANRRNAKLSTGPKTEEGKEIARANAVTHGYTSKVVPHPADVKAVESGREAIAAAYPATAFVSEALIALTALNCAQIKRICEDDQPDLEARAGEARAETIAKRLKTYQELIRLKDDDAWLAADALEKSPEGIEWKIQSWSSLAHDLENGFPLTLPKLHRMYALLGIDRDQNRGTNRAKQIMTFYVDAGGETPTGDVADPESPTTKAGRAWLMDLIEKEWLRLEALKPEVNRAVEEEIQTAVRRSRIDTSARGKVIQRYANAAGAAIIRMTKEMERREREAAARAAVSPEKAPKPAAREASAPAASPCETTNLTAVTERSQFPPPATVEPPPIIPETPLSGTVAPETIRTEPNAS